MPNQSNEQTVVVARERIATLKSNYMSYLQGTFESIHTSIIPEKIKILIKYQQLGNEYFNYVETFVGDSGLLGAHENGAWVIGFAEDCFSILESIMIHHKLLNDYARIIGNDLKLMSPSNNAYSNMQRMVKEYLPKEQSEILLNLFRKNGLPISGFTIPAPNNDRQQRKTSYLAAGIGIFLVLICLFLVYRFPATNKSQFFIVRAVLAIGISCISIIIPGVMRISGRINNKFGVYHVMATESIAIFLLIWISNPPEFAQNVNRESVRDTQTSELMKGASSQPHPKPVLKPEPANNLMKSSSPIDSKKKAIDHYNEIVKEIDGELIDVELELSNNAPIGSEGPKSKKYIQLEIERDRLIKQKGDARDEMIKLIGK